jgi:dTDP-4-dehydrorhamnose reductase
MKFLVLGCNGMAGHMISLYLKEQGHEVLGVARVKSRYVDSIVADAENNRNDKTNY